MVKGSLAFSRRVACQARGVFIIISANSCVLLIRFRIRVAGYTSVDRVVTCIGVAICALAPLSLVGSTLDREELNIVICVLCRDPRIFCMTCSTFQWEVQRNV